MERDKVLGLGGEAVRCAFLKFGGCLLAQMPDRFSGNEKLQAQEKLGCIKAAYEDFRSPRLNATIGGYLERSLDQICPMSAVYNNQMLRRSA